MAKPNAFTPDIKDEASIVFNKILEEQKNFKEPAEEIERITNLVEKVLANSNR